MVRKTKYVKAGGNFSVAKLLTLIICLIIGIILVDWGWGVHKSVIKSFNCEFCSFFDEHYCSESFESISNQQCLEYLEWPFKITLIIPFLGVFIIVLSIITFIKGVFYDNKRRK